MEQNRMAVHKTFVQVCAYKGIAGPGSPDPVQSKKSYIYITSKIMDHSAAIQNLIKASISTKEQLLGDAVLLNTIQQVIDSCVHCFKNDGKILFCGNGGSAADAQHIAAEFTGRFYKDREPLYAEALHVNSSYMTAVANDYSYEKVYSRMVRAMGRKGDILFAISTSGNSGNIVEAVNAAKERGMTVVGMTGSKGGKMKDLCHYLLNMPSDITPRIQESHILVGHIICELVEERMFGHESHE